MAYRVVLAGSVAPGRDIADVRARLATSTGQDLALATRLLSGTPNVIKRGVTQAEAERILAILTELGAVADIEDEATTFAIDAPASAAGGAPPPPPAPPPATDEALYRAIVGPRNSEKYLPFFLARDAGGSFFSWHWPCLFVQLPWAMYRKCWGFALGGLAIGMALSFVIAFIVGVVLALAGVRESIISAAGTVCGWVALALVAMTAKGFYHRKARALIRKTAHLSPESARLAELERLGGTSMLWVWLAILVPVLAIIAAIALGVYLEPAGRSRVKPIIDVVASPRAASYSSIISKSSLRAPHSGHVQLGGTSSHFVPAGMPSSGEPSASS